MLTLVLLQAKVSFLWQMVLWQRLGGEREIFAGVAQCFRPMDIAVQLFVKFLLVISNRKAVDTVMEARNAKCMLSLFVHAAQGLLSKVFFYVLLLCKWTLTMDRFCTPLF